MGNAGSTPKMKTKHALVLICDATYQAYDFARMLQLSAEPRIDWNAVAQKGAPHSAEVRCQRRRLQWLEVNFEDQSPGEK